MEAIPLTALLPDGFDPRAFKVHFAVWNGNRHPIDALATSMDEWELWNSYRSDKNAFNRDFVFSVAQDRSDPTRWLFGGIWEVLERRPENYAQSYTVALREDLLGPFIRRLFIRHKLTGRQIRRTLESVLPDMTISSILEEPFAGEPFPGHDRINHSLAELQTVIWQARADWRIALESMKGVYAIHDSQTGQRYVGSAYGDTGIWQRWTTYAATLHAGNVGLKELLEAEGEEYFRANMRFALLEYWSMRTDDAHVLARESYWKDVLHARLLGHNRN